MKRKRIFWMSLVILAALALAGVMAASAVSGAAFTTFNPWVDGLFKEVCKNSIINCNLYGSKPDVWLNGGPAANGLGPDGLYFFAVLVPGGQPNPNDGGPKNLSDDYDTVADRTFTVTNGEVSAYSGPHELDSGNTLNPNRPYCNKPRGCTPDGQPPLIRLYPYADTTNPGGVYILAICSLERGYPVAPRDCKYDAFKVKEVFTAVLRLSGIKFEDLYADGVKDVTDPGLAGWVITISGTGWLGEPINATITTGLGGYWEFEKDYSYNKQTALVDAQLTVCETLKTDWTQSLPGGDGCYHLVIPPASLAEVPDLDFGNWLPVDVTACKERDLDGEPGDPTVPVAGWLITLTKDGADVETLPTGTDGCVSWSGLEPGFAYDLHEESRAGWEALGPEDVVFDKAKSGDSFSHTFVNAVLEGCTPGFWQGGPDKPDAKAGGSLLWDGIDFVPPLSNPVYPPPHVDQQWIDSGGANPPGNPYIHGTDFNTFFGGGAPGSYTMFELIDIGGGPENWRKAARDLVAAYLNSSWGMNYPYTTGELQAKWSAAVASPDDPAVGFMALHTELDAANNAYNRTDGGPHCPISAGGY